MRLNMHNSESRVQSHQTQLQSPECVCYGLRNFSVISGSNRSNCKPGFTRNCLVTTKYGSSLSLIAITYSLLMTTVSINKKMRVIGNVWYTSQMHQNKPRTQVRLSPTLYFHFFYYFYRYHFAVAVLPASRVNTILTIIKSIYSSVLNV